MKQNEIECFDTKNGKLLYSINKTRKGITKKMLFDAKNENAESSENAENAENPHQNFDCYGVIQRFGGHLAAEAGVAEPTTGRCRRV